MIFIMEQKYGIDMFFDREPNAVTFINLSCSYSSITFDIIYNTLLDSHILMNILMINSLEYFLILICL